MHGCMLSAQKGTVKANQSCWGPGSPSLECAPAFPIMKELHSRGGGGGYHRKHYLKEENFLSGSSRRPGTKALSTGLVRRSVRLQLSLCIRTSNRHIFSVHFPWLLHPSAGLLHFLLLDCGSFWELSLHTLQIATSTDGITEQHSFEQIAKWSFAQNSTQKQSSSSPLLSKIFYHRWGPISTDSLSTILIIHR